MFFDYNDVSFNARQNLLNYLTLLLGGGGGNFTLAPPLRWFSLNNSELGKNRNSGILQNSVTFY